MERSGPGQSVNQSIQLLEVCRSFSFLESLHYSKTCAIPLSARLHWCMNVCFSTAKNNDICCRRTEIGNQSGWWDCRDGVGTAGGFWLDSRGTQRVNDSLPSFVSSIFSNRKWGGKGTKNSIHPGKASGKRFSVATGGQSVPVLCQFCPCVSLSPEECQGRFGTFPWALVNSCPLTCPPPLHYLL